MTNNNTTVSPLIKHLESLNNDTERWKYLSNLKSVKLRGWDFKIVLYKNETRVIDLSENSKIFIRFWVDFDKHLGNPTGVEVMLKSFGFKVERC